MAPAGAPASARPPGQDEAFQALFRRTTNAPATAPAAAGRMCAGRGDARSGRPRAGVMPGATPASMRRAGFEAAGRSATRPETETDAITRPCRKMTARRGGSAPSGRGAARPPPERI